jgi:hypothetical protein
MKYFYFLFIFFLTSCIEIIDDLKINNDGSGTFKYTLNLSSSKIKVKSILSLDSLYGEKIPKENNIKQKITELKNKLKQQEGITNVIVTEDYVNYIFKVQIDFLNVENLEKGLKNVFSQNENNQQDWISFKNKTLLKRVPIFYLDEIKKFGEKEIDKLKTGTYTSITRLESKIDTFENDLSIRSKSNMSLMIKTTPDMLLINKSILDNKIILEK